MDFINKMRGNKTENPQEEKAAQIRREIGSLEVRKNTAQSVADKEKAELEQEKDKVFLAAGKMVYDNYLQGNETDKGLSDYWERIKLFDAEIVQKNEKLKEMQARFDEEIDIMKKELGYLTSTPVTMDTEPSGVAAGGCCPKCGSPISVGDRFCEKCGTKL